MEIISTSSRFSKHFPRTSLSLVSMKSAWPGALLALLLSACASNHTVDPELESEINRIPAIDNHAHPVRVAAAGEQPDRLFDALPVDNMEPQSDPVNFRPGAPAI